MRLLLAEDEHSLSRAVCAILEKNNQHPREVSDVALALQRAMDEKKPGPR